MNVLILVLNAILYFCAFVIVLRKDHRVFLSTVLFGLYSIISIVAIFLYIDPLSEYSDVSFFPFIFLFFMLVLSIYPLRFFENKQKKSPFIEPSSFLFEAFSVVILSAAILFIIRSLPSLGTLSFGDLSSVAAAYSDFRAENDADRDYGIIAALHSICRYFYVFLLFYLLSSKWKFRYFFSFFFATAIIISVLLDFSNGIRGPIIGLAFQVIASLFLFWNRYSEKIKHFVKKFLIIFSLFALTSFSIITLARFSSEDDSVGEAVGYYIKSYTSQSFLNFNEHGLDNGGLRYGDKTFPIIRKYMGLKYSKSYMERRNWFWYLHMDDSYFYTFVGDFTLDFGPFITFLLFLLFFFFYTISFKRKGPLSMGQMILAYIVFIKCSNGFSLYPFAEMGGNRALLFMLIVAFAFEFDAIRQSSYYKVSHLDINMDKNV